MKWRNLLVFLLCLFLLITCFGCGNGEPSQDAQQPTSSSTQEPTYPDSCPSCILIDGVLYRFTGSTIPLRDASDIPIEGETKSSVPYNQIPQKDDESNFLPVGTPYTKWTDEELGEVYIAKSSNKWFILVPEDGSIGNEQ